ncbi:MAG TPA: LysE family translocator [Solirubrobacteraceae bacterium]|jgi:threonine/homoserine/homoserine lactone efflux protein|nr:LysE family translocator [Solirubrobacteraceae bacterium]
MPMHLLVFVGIVVAIVLLPGPDTAVVTKNALIHGREAALGSAIGTNVGVAVWTLATALGVAAVLRSSATVYDALKLLGALYLVWIGIRTLWDSRRGRGDGAQSAAARSIDGRGGFRQGLITDLANPKVGIFFTSLLPQFVSPHGSALLQMLILGGIYIAFSLAWMCGYALLAVRLSHLLSRPRVKALIDRFSGLVLVGVGIRLAIER